MYTLNVCDHESRLMMGKVRNLPFIQFLVRWSPQRTLVPSFFYLSCIMYHVSPFFQITVFTYNFMWFMELRASAGMCGVCAGVCECVWVCAGMRGCARVCAGVHECAQVCQSVHTCMWVDAGRCEWVGAVCAGVHRCVWKCASVCECVC